MQVEEINPLPEAAKEAVADPAGQGKRPQNHRDLDEVPKLLIAGPGKGRRDVRARLRGHGLQGLMGNSRFEAMRLGRAGASSVLSTSICRALPACQVRRERCLRRTLGPHDNANSPALDASQLKAARRSHAQPHPEVTQLVSDRAGADLGGCTWESVLEILV